MVEQKNQLAIFLANAPGAFHRVCKALAEDKIKILAMSVSDTIDHAVLRLIVDEHHKAIHLLGEAGLMLVENEVLLVEMDYSSLNYDKLAEILTEAKINIEYAYSSSTTNHDKFLLVLRTSDMPKTVELLKNL